MYEVCIHTELRLHDVCNTVIMCSCYNQVLMVYAVQVSCVERCIYI